MPAVFRYDAQTGPQHLDLNGIAAGYGVISVPVTGFLPGDVVQTVGLSMAGVGLTPIAIGVDMVQRTGGYYEWTDAASIDAHFTVTQQQIAAIAAAANCTYQVTIVVLRNGVQQLREVQDGKLSARPLMPTPPLVVNSIVLSGGPVSGTIGGQAQLVATCYDGFGNALPSATVTWTSGNPNIASVDASGRVTFIIPGTATISASSQGVAVSTTATVSDPGLVGPTANEVIAWDAGQSNWLPKTLTAAFLSIAAGALIVGGGWPAGASELAPGAAAGYVRSNGSAWVRQAGVPAADVNAGTFGNGAFVFPGSLTVTNGFTVSSGTSALQAVTATTVNASSGFTGNLTGNASTATALATGRTIAITGDLVWTSPTFDGSGNVTAAGTLATVNANVGAFGSSTAIPTFTVNAKGLITAASTAVVIAPASTLTGTTLASNVVASSLTSVGVLASPHMTGPTIDSGGLTITAGTLAAQALTATTGVFSAALSAVGLSSSNGLTVSAGATSMLGLSATTGAFSSTVSTGGLSSSNGLSVSSGTTSLQAFIATTGAFSSTISAIGILSSNGLTVSTGTSALQALTATTGVFSSTASAVGLSSSSGLTVSSGTTAVQALTATTVNTTSNVAVGGVLTAASAAIGGSLSATTLDLNPGGNSHVKVGTWGGASAYNFISLNNDTSAATGVGLYGGATSDGALYLAANAGFVFKNANSTVFSIGPGGAGALVGGLTIAAGGLTVSVGTSALQALTATTGTFTGTVQSPTFVSTSSYGTNQTTLQFVGGSIDTQFKNAANNAANLTISDAGALTVRTSVSIGGGVAIRGNATYPGTADDITPISVANLASTPIGDAGSVGTVLLNENNGANAAIVTLNGGFHSVTIALAIRGTWGTTQGAANNFNVYWDAGTSTYRFENRNGSPTGLFSKRIGQFPT